MKTTRKCYEIADALFYNEMKVPDKMLYIERVMLSCVNREQLDSVYKWGKRVITDTYGAVDRRLSKEGDSADFIRISGRFFRNVKAVKAQIGLYYDEKIRELSNGKEEGKTA